MDERTADVTSPLLTFEFDQYQRYAFLRDLISAAYRESEARAEPVRILDIGSGPERLTEAFLAEHFSVTRADIETFGDESIVVIPSEGEWPFQTGEFDVVVALEVVEHLERSDRPRLVRECLRTARDLVILSSPDGRPEVVRAESRIAAAFELLTGKPHPFLSEHADLGLPSEPEIRGLLEEEHVSYFVAGNAPLDRWEAFLMLDQTLRTVEQGPEIAQTIYRRANTAWTVGTVVAHPYRNFYILPKSDSISAAVRMVLPEPGATPAEPSDLTEPVFQLARLAAAELSDRELERIAAAARARRLAQQKLQAKVAHAELEAQAAEATTRASAAEERMARVSSDLDLLASVVASIAGGRSRPTRVRAVVRQLVELPWTNHPYASHPVGAVHNVQTTGHSLWCFAGAGSLTLQTSLDPGSYRIHAYMASSERARLVVEVGGRHLQLRALRTRGHVSEDVALDEHAQNLRLSLNPPGVHAVLLDVQILRRVEERRSTSISRNLVSLARRRRSVLRLARTPLGRAAAARLISPPAQATETSDYERWIEERLVTRAPLYPKPRRPLSFSLMTTVWNTPARYLDVLAESVLSQSYRDFEWILLDNGSTDPDTAERVAHYGDAKCTHVERVEHNLGIVGGMRRCLDLSSGEYVLPVDSDDFLYRDALQLVASALASAKFPVLAYSDEDKLHGGRFLDPYLKPDWDPILFLNSCYIAHVCAIRRTRALELGVYSDKAAEGCHDWDTFTRFMLAGETPLHIGEVLYSWRMHRESAALNIASKPYLDDSHVHVLQKFLDAHPRSELYRIERSPLWGPTPDWWFHRKHREARPKSVIRLMSSSAYQNGGRGGGATVVPRLSLNAPPSALRPFAEQAAASGALIQFVWEPIHEQDEEGMWDAIALTELHPDTVLVGGRVIDAEGRIVAAGEYFGFGGVCGCPDVGRSENDPGYFGQMWKQRSVSAVSTMLAFVEPRFLLESLQQLEGERASLPFLGAWLGGLAAETHQRVVYTPFILGRTNATREEWDALVSPEERVRFGNRFVGRVPETRYLSRLLSLDAASPYTPSSEEERSEALSRWRVGPLPRPRIVEDTHA